ARVRERSQSVASTSTSRSIASIAAGLSGGHDLAGVGHECLPGYRAGLVGGEEQGRGGDLLGERDLAQRRARAELLDDGLGADAAPGTGLFGVRVEEAALDGAGDRLVHPDAV